jgi:uncharacterized RDD family membrane protein YckC
VGALPPADWYADPNHPNQRRWWDGHQWTDHVSVGQQITVNVNPTAPAAPTWQPTVRPRLAIEHSQLATAGQRCGAWAIDLLTVWGALLAASLFAGMLGNLGSVGGALAAVLFLTTLVASALYGLLYPARCGQTYGKHVLGIKILHVDDGVSAIGGGAAFGRELVKGLGMYAFGLGVLWLLFDRERQGWHDKAVRTVVVRTDQARLPFSEFMASPFRK